MEEKQFMVMPLVSCFFFYGHKKERLTLKTYKPYSASYYAQFIFMYAILLYEQFMAFMQPYITIYDSEFIFCFSYGGQSGIIMQMWTMKTKRVMKVCCFLAREQA